MDNTKKSDLERRTTQFGIDVIRYCQKIPFGNIQNILINQLVRSAGSIGANYMEANGASSKRDFRNKIHLCKKEAQESLHWLRIMSATQACKDNTVIMLGQECHELVLIFGKIIISLKKSAAKDVSSFKIQN